MCRELGFIVNFSLVLSWLRVFPHGDWCISGLRGKSPFPSLRWNRSKDRASSKRGNSHPYRTLCKLLLLSCSLDFIHAGYSKESWTLKVCIPRRWAVPSLSRSARHWVMVWLVLRKQSLLLQTLLGSMGRLHWAQLSAVRHLNFCSPVIEQVGGDFALILPLNWKGSLLLTSPTST